MMLRTTLATAAALAAVVLATGPALVSSAPRQAAAGSWPAPVPLPAGAGSGFAEKASGAATIPLPNRTTGPETARNE
jgi:hypothetical protein